MQGSAMSEKVDEQRLLDKLNAEQKAAVKSKSRLLGVVAGAGSGKTEVMSRRVAWWVEIDGVDRSKVIAFTFTEAAAEELKFRVRQKLQMVAEPGEGATLSGMYVGTIHAFCLKCLREFAPTEYYNFDVLDDAGRMSLIERGFWNVLGLQAFQTAANAAGTAGRFQPISLFLRSYDILNEHVAFKFTGPDVLPARIEEERDWCKEYETKTKLGNSALNQAFASSAARYYAYLKARRFLDFSTAQAEFVRKLATDKAFKTKFLETFSHLVVDEVQDINPAQLAIINTIIDAGGHVTAVGDHRQAIYSFRGGRVDLMGAMFGKFQKAKDGDLLSLPANYRSTPRIVEVANRWASTIGAVAGLPSPDMSVADKERKDFHANHVAAIHFQDRDSEAAWIASTINQLVPPSKPDMGAAHGEKEKLRGISYGDISILVRSTRDIGVYKDTLRGAGIPAVVRGGADLFSQVEVLVFLSALSVASGSEAFLGGAQDTSLPQRVLAQLGTGPRHEQIIPAALTALRNRGMKIPRDAAARVIALCKLVHRRLSEEGRLQSPDISKVRNPEARKWLGSSRRPRRLFPQTVLQWILEEASFGDWADLELTEYETIRFHVGQLSGLLKGVETSGWTGPGDAFKYQLINMTMWGAGAARTPEAPLLVAPQAVSITTIHASKGLEFPVVFVADVVSRRFPSQRARTVDKFAFDPAVVRDVDPRRLADNANYDDERRLMYVALTRAERLLFVTASGSPRSKFFDSVAQIVADAGGISTNKPVSVAKTISLEKRGTRRDQRLTTSFSDLRYFLECPQDFFIRKVLGFTPPIGQEFGYGRGVHNLLRAIHENPKPWVAMKPALLEQSVRTLVDKGLFYLRHTVGEPYENLRDKAISGVVEYVNTYRDELSRLNFEPEKSFETLFPEEGVLVSGAIDVVRLDDPPQVTLVDFKSGNAKGDNASGLSEQMMAMQLGVYGLAARKELEYEPNEGLVRYIGESNPQQREKSVAMSDAQLEEVRKQVVRTAINIRERRFKEGPTAGHEKRCGHCDFCRICPTAHAQKVRSAG
jgi:DNA helicase-2/ATP-dependent DNA helicase PcrA